MAGMAGGRGRGAGWCCGRGRRSAPAPASASWVPRLGSPATPPSGKPPRLPQPDLVGFPVQAHRALCSAGWSLEGIMSIRSAEVRSRLSEGAMRVDGGLACGGELGVLARYLLASMALQSLWSLGLAFLDGYAIKNNKDLTSPILVSLFLVGDWVTALLSFAASCSAGGVVILFKRDVLFCRRYPQLPCGRYEIATAFAFVAWALSATSAIIMFWLLASS
ncbi:hypothetical protein EJB05_35816, partial [Eragrostis curvula]